MVAKSVTTLSIFFLTSTCGRGVYFHRVVKRHHQAFGRLIRRSSILKVGGSLEKEGVIDFDVILSQW